MFSALKPTRSEIEFFIESSLATDFSYREIGRSRDGAPSDYNVDHYRVIIGCGDEEWERAKDAVRGWKMFDITWIELCRPTTPIIEGETVAILIYHFGFYSLNAARIVYTVDEPHRFGFAYGTLADHGESGEERFLVEMNAENGEISYDLFAFSRPNHPMTKLGYPLTRMLQKQFATDSKAAMTRAMLPSNPAPEIGSFP